MTNPEYADGTERTMLLPAEVSLTGFVSATLSYTLSINKIFFYHNVQQDIKITLRYNRSTQFRHLACLGHTSHPSLLPFCNLIAVVSYLLPEPVCTVHGKTNHNLSLNPADAMNTPCLRPAQVTHYFPPDLTVSTFVLGKRKCSLKRGTQLSYLVLNRGHQYHSITFLRGLPTPI